MNTTSLPSAAGFKEPRQMPMDPWLSPHLRAATQHALQSRGGGFRASLVESMCRASNLDQQRATLLASALEYFHLASLLLDDLPCMDNADTRRGLPCTHRVYGESMAILSALGFINRAYYYVWESANRLEPRRQREINKLLDQCLGLSGILNGQALDLKFITTNKSPATIERIALLKTGSLLRLSILLPWVAGDGNSATKILLRRISDKWGYIYQLLDDFKDIEWGEHTSGKTPLRDVALNHPNLAIALGKERAVARLRKHLEDSRQIMQELSSDFELAEALEPFQEKLEAAASDFLSQCAA